MTELIMLLLTATTALATALVGGVFFIFSVTIMRAFAGIPPPAAISAMQEINVVILSSAFMPLFMGTALTSTVLAVYGFLGLPASQAYWLLAGALLYIFGSFILTIACNVPLNNGLAAVDASSSEALPVWTRYLGEWTMWNHLRTVASIASSACMIMAIVTRH